MGWNKKWSDFISISKLKVFLSFLWMRGFDIASVVWDFIEVLNGESEEIEESWITLVSNSINRIVRLNYEIAP